MYDGYAPLEKAGYFFRIWGKIKNTMKNMQNKHEKGKLLHRIFRNLQKKEKYAQKT